MRTKTTPQFGALLALALSAPACAFVLDFPAIERLGEGGAGAGGGATGGGGVGASGGEGGAGGEAPCECGPEPSKCGGFFATGTDSAERVNLASGVESELEVVDIAEISSGSPALAINFRGSWSQPDLPGPLGVWASTIYELGVGHDVELFGCASMSGFADTRLTDAHHGYETGFPDAYYLLSGVSSGARGTVAAPPAAPGTQCEATMTEDGTAAGTWPYVISMRDTSTVSVAFGDYGPLRSAAVLRMTTANERLYVLGVVQSGSIYEDTFSTAGGVRYFVASFIQNHTPRAEWIRYLGEPCPSGGDVFADLSDLGGDLVVLSNFDGGERALFVATQECDDTPDELLHLRRFDLFNSPGLEQAVWKAAAPGARPEALAALDLGGTDLDVVVAGSFTSSPFESPVLSSRGGRDVFVARFAPDFASNSQPLAAVSLGGPGDDRVRAVKSSFFASPATSPSNGVFVTGSFQGDRVRSSSGYCDSVEPGPATKHSAFVLALDASFQTRWLRGLGGSGDVRGAALSLGGDSLLLAGELRKTDAGGGLQLDDDENYDVETEFKSAFAALLSYGE